MIPAPDPCRIRANISKLNSGANCPIIQPVKKSVEAKRNVFRAPIFCSSQADASMQTAFAQRKPVDIHCADACVTL